MRRRRHHRRGSVSFRPPFVVFVRRRRVLNSLTTCRIPCSPGLCQLFGEGVELSGDHAAHDGLAAAVLPPMEQLPDQPDQRLRSAPPERELRGCYVGVRWTLGEGAQNGIVSLQPLLPVLVLREPLPAPHSHHERH